MQTVEAGQAERRLPEKYHRVQYYLSARRDAGQGFSGKTVSDVDCLRTIVEQCQSVGLADPTWQQLTAFVNFLDRFLSLYEVNPFCGPAAAEDLPGFGRFIVDFLKRGARDFSLPSLGGEGAAGDDGIDAYMTRRKWEHEDHPYVSFTSGGAFDFFGFHISSVPCNRRHMSRSWRGERRKRMR